MKKNFWENEKNLHKNTRRELWMKNDNQGE
jgi:hypothetical protein